MNGVYLAKALAHNRSQDALRDLWLSRGDIKGLLRGPGWLPLFLKVPWLLATVRKKPPLKGDDMSRWIYGALRDMDERRLAVQPTSSTLMPPGAPAGALRDDDGLLRLRPRPHHRRSAADPRPLAPARARLPPRRRGRPLLEGLQRGARVLGARDLVLPGRLPAGEPRAVRVVPEGRRRRSLQPRALLPSLQAVERRAWPDVLRRRRCPRQPPVRPCDPRAQAEAGRVRGRPAAPLPRAPPRGAGPQAARQVAEPDPDDPRHDLGHPEEGADPRRDPRRLAAQRARPAHPRHHRDDVRSDRRAGRGDRRAATLGRLAETARRPRTSASGATASTRRRRRRRASPTRPTSAAR